jgi:hypothetical protein
MVMTVIVEANGDNLLLSQGRGVVEGRQFNWFGGLVVKMR